MGDRPRRRGRGPRVSELQRAPGEAKGIATRRSGTERRHNGVDAERCPPSRSRSRESVLRHDAHLLRERRAPHRARLHDGRGRRAHPVAPPARRGGLLPHRHRRARPRRSSGPRRPRGWSPPSSCARWPACSANEWDAPRHRLRRLHPHHRAAPPQSGAGVPAAHLRRGRHRARHSTKVSTASRARRITPKTSS